MNRAMCLNRMTSFHQEPIAGVWNVQFCAEYYPLKNSELLCYLHLLYKNIHLTEKARSWGAESYNHQRISLGLVYTLPVF